MTWLLDGNVPVALAIDSHEFHECARQGFDVQTEPFATCAVTEGTLLRVSMRLAADRRTEVAWEVLGAIHAMESHEFRDTGLATAKSRSLPGITGWADITDAWLAELARSKQGRLATMDAGLATRYPDVIFLIPE